MALYFDSNLDSPPGSSASCLSWHNQQGILAVGYQLTGGVNGIVQLYNKDGANLSPGGVMKRTAPPTVAAWSPKNQLLAVGWENGDLLIWNDQKKELHEVPGLHTKAISTISWTGQGTRLASGDSEGVFAVWKIDGQGRIQHNPLSRHDLGPAVTDAIAKYANTVDGQSNQEIIAQLARAAVRGDEHALDMLANQHSKDSRLRLKPHKSEELSFYVGTSDGVVHHIDEKGSRSACFTLDSSVQQILYCSEKDFLVAVSCDLQVIKCQVHDSGDVEELEKVKFSGKERSARIAWADVGLLAAATSDQSLRLWDLVSGDNFTLQLQESAGFSKGEFITNVSCVKGMIAAGTNLSKIAVWKSVPPTSKAKSEPEDKWQLQSAVNVAFSCDKIEWCTKFPVLGGASSEGALVLAEEMSKSAMSGTMVAVQTGPRQLSIDLIGQKTQQKSSLTGLGLSPSHTTFDPETKVESHVDLQVDTTFNGVAVSNEFVAVWNGKQMEVFEVNQRSQTVVGSFECQSHVNALHDQSLFCIEAPKDAKDRTKIQARNFQGTVKQLIHFQENEGDPLIMSVTGDFMVVGTSIGHLRVYDLSRRDAKPHCSSKNMAEVIERFGAFHSLSCNHNGSKVAVVCIKDNGVPDSKVYVYNTEQDTVENFDFVNGRNDQDEFGNDTGPKSDVEQ